MNKLKLYADPLGDFYVEWKIATAEKITVNLPHYKYEMSNLLGIPVPFSSIAEKIECEVLNVYLENAPDIVKPYIVQKKFMGGFDLLVTDNSPDQTIVIQYVIRNLVIRDKIYFHFVFILASPLPTPVIADVTLTARFSYDINSYKFKAAVIDNETGRICGKAEVMTHQRTGDFIQVTGSEMIVGENSLDLHMHASRLPLMIDRRIFWLVIFIVTIIGISTLLSILKLK